MRTQSEIWFEEFCANEGIVCLRISEEDKKTPDYQLQIGDKSIIVEIKEFSRNKTEIASDKLLEERGYGECLTNAPGYRVQKKIADSSAQIKAKTNGIYPSILVLCDIKYGCGQVTGHTDPYHIRVGMYGLEQIHIAIPSDGLVGPYVAGVKYGSKRKMTANQNTSFSAIGVLSTPNKDDIRLDLYHNFYAANPLDPKLIEDYKIRQYCSDPKLTEHWKEIDIKN